jgi:hypothetical protein
MSWPGGRQTQRHPDRFPAGRRQRMTGKPNMSDDRQSATVLNPPAEPSRLNRLFGRGLLSGGREMSAVARLIVFALALILLSVSTVAIDWGSGRIVVEEGDAADQTI